MEPKEPFRLVHVDKLLNQPVGKQDKLWLAVSKTGVN